MQIFTFYDTNMQPDTLYDHIIDSCMSILKVTERLLRIPKDLTQEKVENLKSDMKILREIVDSVDKHLANARAPIVNLNAKQVNNINQNAHQGSADPKFPILPSN